MKKIATFILFLSFAYLANAQVKTPQPSPESTVKQKIGLTDIEVNYSRPSVKGRTIFGELVPFGKLWRTGANASTDIEFSNDFKFGDQEVKAGKYSIYSYPNKDEWKVILYKDTDHWGTPGDQFNEDLIAAEYTTKPVQVSPLVETFTIGFDALRNETAHLTLSWENTAVSIPISVDTKTPVMKSIEKTFSGPTANDYYSAANYYYSEEIQLENALKWINKAVEMRPEAFWILKVKSEIQAKMGDYKGAIKTAKLSIQKAEKAQNVQYVKFNKENITNWKKK